MSTTSVQEGPAQGLSSSSGQTLPLRPLQPLSDPSASKRVCFYKSGDYKFSGHRMVINARTFKTFDALLDALSKKVPLPFGVRTITTPRGTHLVKALDDLQDGGAYICSDQKRVKPLNLDEVNRRQVPWNTTRPVSAGRRRRQGLRLGQFGRDNESSNRPAKVTERVAVRTPKKLVVIKNKDPIVKRTVVLQRRTAPTFDALLDYLSQILQFPVLKLYSTDGRRVDSLAALILCSGVVVAAGNEPFRLGNYSFNRAGQMAEAMYVETVDPSLLHHRAQKSKSYSSGRGSRNFSLSSERYIVNQINKSQNGGMNGHLLHHRGSLEAEVHQHPIETSGKGDNEHNSCIVPQDDDIEKSFRVNQDGSMTVEMKVRLTIKEEEMLHWTTTLSRSSLIKRSVCASIPESGNSSPDSNNAVAKGSLSISGDETKEENYPAGPGKGVGFNDETIYEGYATAALGKTKKSFKRTPTPGPRHVNKTASVESVKMVTDSGVQESTLGHYSYMERTADGETTEGYCVVRHSSSSNRPIPKPRKTASAGGRNKHSNSSIRSSGVAEVLQIENNGMEVTETVMHIYESQGCYDNYFANDEYSADDIPLHDSTVMPESKPSTDSGPRSSCDDCDIDCSWQPPTADSLQRQKEEMLSLSSEPLSPRHQITNNLSSVTKDEAQTATNSQSPETAKKDNSSKSMKKKKIIRPASNQKSSTSTSSIDKKAKERIISSSKNSKHSSTDKLSSNASVRKKSLNSSDSAKSGQKSTGAAKKAETPQSKKSIKDEKMPKKDSALLDSSENVKRTSPKRQNMIKAVAKDNGHNVNTSTGRPQMKKNMSDILQTKKSSLSGQKTISKPKSMIENRISPPKKSLELSESVSMPSLNPSPSQIHQYVEDWLETVTPDAGPYMEEAITDGTERRPNVVFQIGGDSESDEKTECQATLDECYPSTSDAVKKSASCLSVPLYHEGPALLHSEQKARGLCVSMPSVRVDPAYQESNLRSHKSAEAIGGADNEECSSNILSPKAKIRPVLRQLCSSIQCIRRASDINTTSNLEKSNSVPDFPTQVASVFGSSCKAFMTFLSVMTLRDNLNHSESRFHSEERNQPRTTSEAMLMMESLQKISAIDDDEEQRASLTDLHSRASSQLRERWKDFQILRERFESEPLSPKVSETEFALDVVSEGGDVFDEHIDELMDELNMPGDLRAEIASTIQQAKSFYPVEESSLMETDRHHSDSEDDVEQFVKEDETKQSAELNSTCLAEDITETQQGNDEAETDYLNKTDTQEEQIESEQRTESEQEPNEAQESQTEREEPSIDKQNDIEENDGEADEVEGMNNTEVLDIEDEGNKKEDSEGEEEAVEEVVEEHEKKEELEEWEAEKGNGEECVEKVEEETDEEMTVDEDEVEKGLEERETEVDDETEDGSVDEETREGDRVEETDEREGDEETGEEENSEEEETEMLGDETSKEKEDEKELDEIMEEAGEEEEAEIINEKVEEEEEEEEKDEESEDAEEEEVTEVHDEEKEMEEVIEEKDEEDEVENMSAEMEDEVENITAEMEDEVENITAEMEDEVENITAEMEDEVENISAEMEDEVENISAEMEDEVENISAEMEEEEGEDMYTVTVKDVEEEANEEAEEEEEMEVVSEDKDEEDEEEVEGKEEVKEQVAEVVSEENEEEEEENEEEEEREQEEEHGEEDGEDVEVKNTEETIVQVMTDEEVEECDKDEEEEQYDEAEDSGNIAADSVEEKETVEELEVEENVAAGHTVDEEERNDEDKEFDEELDRVEEQSKDEAEEANVAEDVDSFADDEDCRSMPGEAFHQQQHDSSCEQADSQSNTESPTKYSSEGQCEDDKGNGTDTVSETDEAGEHCEEGSSSVTHPVEISQQLLDFVNYALQSSSLVFTYDTQGNIRIEPDNAQVIQNKQTVIPKTRKDSSYGLKRLPSPSTSDLSDYRPETSESDGYKTQESVEIVSESGEEASEKASPVNKYSAFRTESTNAQQEKLSIASNSEALYSSQLKGAGSFSSSDSATKASGEDLSYFSAASSSKTDADAATQAPQCTSFASEKDPADGVLIDQGRWLLKENHLIRKSPPVSLGMYGNLDSTSMDTGQENNGEDSPVHSKNQHSPLAAISSSELEEMAKPLTPRCTYYNMPHGSDSDPFMDDSFVKSGKNDSMSFKGKSVRVSPMVDTSKTWANKNGSLSSFASVEFKIPDRKVHPEGESSAVARRTSSGGGHVLQAQDSLETLHVRCGQYCPIL